MLVLHSWTLEIKDKRLGGNTMAPSGLCARLCHAFLVVFFSLTQDKFDIVPVCTLACVSFTYLHTTIYTPKWNSWLRPWSRMPSLITKQESLRAIFIAHCCIERHLLVISTYVHGEAQSPFDQFVVNVLYKHLCSKYSNNLTSQTNRAWALVLSLAS